MNAVKNSEGWLQLRRMLDEKIDKTLELLEMPSDHDRTAMLRGEIGAYRQLIRDVEEERDNHPGQAASYGQ